jgi:hypothetical protein
MTPKPGAAGAQVGDTAENQTFIERIVEKRHLDGVTYSLEWTRCGKAAAGFCRKCAKQRYGHGPYWHARWLDPERGRTRSKYIGKTFRELTADERAGVS